MDPPTGYTWLADNFFKDRAALAQAHGKPSAPSASMRTCMGICRRDVPLLRAWYVCRPPSQPAVVPLQSYSRSMVRHIVSRLRPRVPLQHHKNSHIQVTNSTRATGADYYGTREDFLGWMQDRANENDYACTLVWAVSHYSAQAWRHGQLMADDNAYVFGYDGDGAQAVLRQYAYMRAKVRVPACATHSQCKDARQFYT